MIPIFPLWWCLSVWCSDLLRFLFVYYCVFVWQAKHHGFCVHILLFTPVRWHADGNIKGKRIQLIRKTASLSSLARRCLSATLHVLSFPATPTENMWGVSCLLITCKRRQVESVVVHVALSKHAQSCHPSLMTEAFVSLPSVFKVLRYWYYRYWNKKWFFPPKLSMAWSSVFGTDTVKNSITHLPLPCTHGTAKYDDRDVRVISHLPNRETPPYHCRTVNSATDRYSALKSVHDRGSEITRWGLIYRGSENPSWCVDGR